MDHSDLRQLDELLTSINEECRRNESARSELDADPRAFFHQRGYDVPGEAEIRVVANTPDVVHLALPPDPNEMIADDVLTSVAGGTGTVEAGSWSSIISCISSMVPRED